MMRKAAVLFVVSLAGALALPGTGARAAEAGSGPQATVEAFHAALAAGNREKALDLLAPKIVVYEQGDAEMSRDEYASHHLKDDIEFLKGVEVKVLDRTESIVGELAWVISRTETKGTYDEKPVASRGVETMILRRDVGHWQIVHIHWSSRAKK